MTICVLGTHVFVLGSMYACRSSTWYHLGRREELCCSQWLYIYTKMSSQKSLVFWEAIDFSHHLLAEQSPPPPHWHLPPPRSICRRNAVLLAHTRVAKLSSCQCERSFIIFMLEYLLYLLECLDKTANPLFMSGSSTQMAAHHLPWDMNIAPQQRLHGLVIVLRSNGSGWLIANLDNILNAIQHYVPLTEILLLFYGSSSPGDESRKSHLTASIRLIQDLVSRTNILGCNVVAQAEILGLPFGILRHFPEGPMSLRNLSLSFGVLQSRTDRSNQMSIHTVLDIGAHQTVLGR